MAMILDAFISKFVALLVDLAKEEVDMLLGVPGEIEKLQNKLHMISEVLADAERRRITERAIDYWFKQLKDVMYDADDILDLCRIEADKCSEGSSSTSSVGFPFPLLSCFRKPLAAHEIGTKIRELNLKLEEISRGRSEYNLQISFPDKQEATSQKSCKTSSVGEIDIVGSEIEEHTRSLIDLLIKDDIRRNILVFSIVGVGGIGKTTLAKKIYNDQRIQEEFAVKKWVCVSQDFDYINLLKDIYNGSKDDLAGDQSKSSLEPEVESSLRGKKLFLVLDDVWIAKVWCGLLCNTLKSCAAGSRILVTTRNEQVAMEMMAVNIHHVDKLSLEDSWSLLCKKVVLTGEEGEIQHLKDIGMEIVKKCDGLPLAIKAVAGMLCTKEKTRNAWNRVLGSTAWSTSGLPEEVKGALYLSYEDLPSYLKQCFTYCSLFPEDHQIYKDTITELWIAEGFVKAEGSLTMEETSEEYYRDLIMRNLLQPSFGGEYACQMHDLLHCLARYMAQDESSVVTKEHKVGSSNRPMKLRRVFVSDNETTEIPDVFVKQDLLRTLIWKQCPISETQMDVIFNKFSRLRVLDISKSTIKKLPDSLGNLIQLRYLNISHSKISVIPESIGNLRTLQTLNMSDIKISMIPESIGNLRNLQRLDISHIKITMIRKSIGNLRNLQRLNMLGTKISAIPESIGNLRNLERLNMSSTKICVIPESIGDLRNLERLNMSGTEISVIPETIGNLRNLRELDISRIKISMIPESIGNLRNLQFLKIVDCASLSRLPNSIVNLHNLRSLDLSGTGVVGMPVGLGRLQNLHTLRGSRQQGNMSEGLGTMEELRSLVCLTDLLIEKLECISSNSEAKAAELRNKSRLRSLSLSYTQDLQPSVQEMRRIEMVLEELHPPPSLEELQITNYFGREFPKWMAETSSSASILFPNLRLLTLYGSRNCERLPPCGLLPNLKFLHISVADSVIYVGPEFLVGTGSSSSSGGRAGVDTSKYAFPRLETLIIENMPNWQEWHWDKGTQAMPCLNRLELWECPKLMSLPEGLPLNATSLTTLTIKDAGGLTTIENFLSLKELIINNSPNLEKVSDLPALTTLDVYCCLKLKVVENLQSLKRMNLFDYDMKSLPSYLLEGVHTAHLEMLVIWCSMELIRNICQRDSLEWQIIQGIQQVRVYSLDESVHVLYNKSPFSFTTNLNTNTTSSNSEMPSTSNGTTL